MIELNFILASLINF